MLLASFLRKLAGAFPSTYNGIRNISSIYIIVSLFTGDLSNETHL